MNGEQWKKIELLFHRAVELPVAERSRFLDCSCADDAELRRHLELLIAQAEKKADSFQQEFDAAVSGLLLDKNDRLMPSQKIGHYEIFSLLGAGGMGEVYIIAVYLAKPASRSRLVQKMRGAFDPQEFRR